METESGIEFLSRINVKPIPDFGKDLFPAPLEPPQLIEISGSAGTGKSLLCLDFMISTLLPKTLFGIPLGGLESEVIFIDCDQHFNILHFTDMIERKIKRICHETRSEWKKLGSEKEHEELMTIKKKDYNNQIENTIKRCLTNFIYFNCSNSNQFATTLLCLEQCLSDKTNVCLVVIDSISAFYWYDRIYKVENWHKMEGYLNNLFHVFLDIIKRYHLICISTRQDLFRKRKDEGQDQNNIQSEPFKADESVAYEYLGKEWANRVTVRVNMALQPKCGIEIPFQSSDIEVSCTVETLQENVSKITFCTFHEDGIRWLKANARIKGK